MTLNTWPDLLDFSLWLCKLEIIIAPAHRGLLRDLSEWICETHSTWLALNFSYRIYYHWSQYLLQDSCSEKKVLDSVEKDPPHFPHHYSSTWRLPGAAPFSVFTLHQWNIVPYLPEGGRGNEWGNVTTLLCTWLGIIKKIPSAQQAYLGLDHSGSYHHQSSDCWW